jgi:hypothetical protein
MLMSKIDPLTKDAIIDTMLGWELVEFLQIPVEDIVEMFEDEILENIEDVMDLANIRSYTENSEEEDNYDSEV